MTTDTVFESIVVFDWFDAPVAGIALSEAGEDLSFDLVGDPPVNPDSIYRVRRLRRGAYDTAQSLLQAKFGVSTDPMWVPRWTGGDEIKAALEPQLEVLLDQVGYFQGPPAPRVDRFVAWFGGEAAEELGALTPAEIRASIL
jgi:hypothetical protein